MRKLFILFGFSIATLTVSAQVTKTKDTLKTETINVTKSYKPTVSDAFKLNDNPSVQDDQSLVKEKIQYQIQSVPVASTFTPAKGKAQSLERPKKEMIYSSFLSLGYGNFSSPYVESFLKKKIERENSVRFYGFYNASKNGVSDAIIDDEFANLNLQAAYQHHDQYYNWNTKVSFDNKKYNWYGLPELTYSPTLIENLDFKQQYKTFGIDGGVEFEEFFLNDIKAGISLFKDDYKSKETQLFATTEMSFPISTEKISIEAEVDLLKGSFEKEYHSLTDLEHSFLKLGLNPTFQVLRENFMLNLGVNLTYSFDLEHRESKLYSYPNVYASLKLMDDIVIPFIGVIGELQSNSYKNLSTKNPFVSPTIEVKETDQTYNAFIGFKGNVSNSMNYQIKASLINEKEKPFFLLNQSKTTGFSPISYSYEAGNSFGLTYDDVKTIEIEAQAGLNITDEFAVQGKVVYSNYDTENLVEAFNLPSYQAVINANYQAKKWYLNSAVSLVGETKDYQIPFGLFLVQPFTSNILAPSFVIKNKAYVDVDVSAGYHFTNRLTAFANISNLLNSDHKTFAHYKVQGIQAIAGITYKFDL